MFIDLELEINSSEVDYQIVEVPGRDGDLIIPNDRFKSFVQEIPVIYTGQYSKRIENIEKAKKAMLVDAKFHDFTFNSEPNHIYKAAFLSAFKVGKTYAESTQMLQFEMMPYKYLINGQNKLTAKPGDNIGLFNTGNIVAKPLIKLTGSGDFKISIAGQTLNLKGVDGGIIMDSKAQTATNLAGTRTQFDKMYNDFLTVDPGNHTLTFSESDNDATLEITPRWAVRT